MPTKLSPRLAKESESAPFVFLGRVREVGANNLQGISPAPNHALVEVEDVLIAPASLGRLRGRVLTVVLKSPATKGSRGVWWATSWIFDREIGVIETARSEGTRAMTAATEVIEARLAALDALVLDRVTGADLIIGGIVTGVEELGLDGIAEGTTWRRALIRVTTVVKGEGGAETVIQFPGIGSPRWADAPRLVLEQQGVWLCRKPSSEPRMRKVKISGAWVALDPNDVHAPSSLGRIEALVRIAERQTPPRRTRRAARAR
jgi:hypothetical protein